MYCACNDGSDADEDQDDDGIICDESEGRSKFLVQNNPIPASNSNSAGLDYHKKLY